MRKLALAVLVIGISCVRGHQNAEAAPPPPDVASMDAVARAVSAKYVENAELERIRWPSLVVAAKRRLLQANTPADRDQVFEGLLRNLTLSHTEYLSRTNPDYWELASTFEELFEEAPEQCDRRNLPSWPVEWSDVGGLWRTFQGHWFLIGVFDNGPAKAGGLLSGDEILLADGKPFNPVVAFAGKVDRTVALTVRRSRGAGPIVVNVTPRRSRPKVAFREALRASARIIERSRARIGYFRIWSWAGSEMQEDVLSAIDGLRKKGMSALVVDIRDGWGGAAPDYLDIFNRNVPVVESRSRDGEVYRLDDKVRVPAVILVNSGSRSGKETVAYGAKKFHLAKLVGERTAGAFSAGSPFCLPNGNMLYVASSSVLIDGESLEGRGVTPDVIVPFDPRYAAGIDPQLEAAIRLAGEGAPP
jgi:carboxyl-terminal processing protease